MKEEKFTITNKTKSTLPRVPFAKMKDAVLGKDYSLSLVFIGESKSKKLNASYRGKNKSTNILSFPIDNKTGEIFITLKVLERQKKSFGRKTDNFAAFLFIHGLLHLKGHEHGDTMEKAEEVVRRKFGI